MQSADLLRDPVLKEFQRRQLLPKEHETASDSPVSAAGVLGGFMGGLGENRRPERR
ncbi:MAG: hypothetical protein ACSHW9_04030 [Salinibacterium amurskyense]